MAAIVSLLAPAASFLALAVKSNGQACLRTRTDNCLGNGRTCIDARAEERSSSRQGTRRDVCRRDLNLALLALSGSALLPPTTSTRPALADEEPAVILEPETAGGSATEDEGGLIVFESAFDRYSLRVPQGWDKGEGSVGTRKLVAFHPPSTTSTNVSVLLTPLGADFTTLGSFGTVEDFGDSLVNGLDRSYQKKGGQKAVLLSANKSGNMYVIEYTIEPPGQPMVHLLSAVAVGFNGIYNQLYTLTAQYLEEDAAAYKRTISEIVRSFNVRL